MKRRAQSVPTRTEVQRVPQTPAAAESTGIDLPSRTCQSPQQIQHNFNVSPGLCFSFFFFCLSLSYYHLLSTSGWTLGPRPPDICDQDLRDTIRTVRTPTPSPLVRGFAEGLGVAAANQVSTQTQKCFYVLFYGSVK